MPRKPRTPFRPRDVNELAFRVRQIATHQVEDDALPQVSEGTKKRGEVADIVDLLVAKESEQPTT